MAQNKHTIVKKAYGSLAQRGGSCCSPAATSCCNASAPGRPVPEADLGLSCGDPVAFSQIQPGDVVLDLGSGAGKDVFIAAEKAGPKGKAIGVDMTPEMLDLARRNAELYRKRTGLKNVEFREGTIEKLPLPKSSVDLIISNCVINLSPHKLKVFKEAYRVLKRNGRMVVSDIVLNRALPASAKSSKDLYVGCIAGAMLREEYLRAIRKAGFTTVAVLNDHTFASRAAGESGASEVMAMLEGAAASITILATK
jgi:ubiquinone/menaquinone biosynthesis C-methylase UbiE